MTLWPAVAADEDMGLEMGWGIGGIGQGGGSQRLASM